MLNTYRSKPLNSHMAHFKSSGGTSVPNDKNSCYACGEVIVKPISVCRPCEHRYLQVAIDNLKSEPVSIL